MGCKMGTDLFGGIYLVTNDGCANQEWWPTWLKPTKVSTPRVTICSGET
jgi:hypothetical protein